MTPDFESASVAAQRAACLRQTATGDAQLFYVVVRET